MSRTSEPEILERSVIKAPGEVEDVMSGLPGELRELLEPAAR
jgi:hypothetical protein